jgi:hypothetical protein
MAVGQSFAASGVINHGWPTLDKVPPVITLLGNNPATVECGAAYTDAGATAFDNIDGDITASIVAVSTVDTSVKGDYTVTYNVTDISGNPAIQVVRTVTVVDTTAPVITDCGPNQSVSADGSCQGAVPDFTAAVAASDNCSPVGNLVITQNPTEGSLLAIGDHTITLTVTDESGNPATCQATLTVTDDTPPTAACQNVTVNLTAPTLAATALDGGSTDNCAVTSWLIDGAADRTFTCADMPSTSVTLTVADAAGNEDTCTATITVVDDIAPNAVCQNLTVNLGAPTVAAADIDGGSTDNCTITTLLIDGAPSQTYSCADMPSKVVTLRVEDGAGNFDECPATLTFVDNVPPVAVCKNVTVNLSTPTIAASAIDGGSTDNCGITSRLINGAASRTFTCANLGANTVTLRVRDAAGNFDECSATVTVVDDIPPVAGCRGSVTVNLSSPTIPGSALNLASSDNCGGLSYQIDGAPSRTFTCADLGANTVTLTVLDGTGNTATCTSTVTVVDNVAPIAACKDATVYLSSPTLVPGDIDNGSSDNCAITSMLVNGAASITYGAGDVGVQSVTLRVLDAAGLFAECTAQVTVVDDTVEGEGEPPVEGEGEPPVEGEGEPPVEGEGEPPVEGEGEPPVEGEGELPVEGEGEPVEGEGEGLVVTADPVYFERPIGDSVTFEVVVSGADGALSFQWYRYTPDKALEVIPDANDATYTITDIIEEDAGQYQCEVYDDVLEETVLSPMFTLVIGTGMPAAGLVALALAAVLTSLTGATVMRKRK